MWATLRVYLLWRCVRDYTLAQLPRRHTIASFQHLHLGSAYAFKVPARLRTMPRRNDARPASRRERPHSSVRRRGLSAKRALDRL
jgi:hypothetical protein